MTKHSFTVFAALLIAGCATATNGTPTPAATMINNDVLPDTAGGPLPDGRSAPKLLRIPYASIVTGKEREYLVYLPAGYESQPSKKWPVMLFLHGDGERGNGKDELDLVMKHGPLHEAWEKRRDLPFIMISPQLPLHKTLIDLGLSSNKEVKFPGGVFEIDRTPHNIDPDWEAEGPPRGWFMFEKEVIKMVDDTVAQYRSDDNRVYVTGLSYGGFGTWHFAERFPTKFAAFAPICGAGDVAGLQALATAQTPLWAFHGGRDSVVLPEWQLKTVQALVKDGHKSVRFTAHEDLSHNSWERVYGGWDLYLWLLQQTRAN